MTAARKSELWSLIPTAPVAGHRADVSELPFFKDHARHAHHRGPLSSSGHSWAVHEKGHYGDPYADDVPRRAVKTLTPDQFREEFAATHLERGFQQARVKQATAGSVGERGYATVGTGPGV